VTFLIFAGILIILAIIYFISQKANKAKIIGTTAVFAVCCVISPTMGFAFWEKDLAYEGESVYNYLQVKDNERRALLSTNVLFGVQSVYMKSGGLTGMYYDYAMAAPLMADTKEKTEILVLGMGTGTYAKQCCEYFDNTEAEGVEIDGKIIELSREYFGLPDSIEVTEYDGRAYLNVCDKKYDVIMVDAYQDITIPFQMSSREFFSEVRSHLKDGGIMVCNMNMRSKENDGINSYLSDTIADVFQEVYTVDVSGSTNRELFASDDPEMLERFRSRTAELKNPELSAIMDMVDERIEKYENGGLILTDDKAPVELLGMSVIDDLIQEELAYYKERFEEDGIKGLLE
ncbi:MAG: fused MFS/spermidine synthase, partial [Ruminococcus sp.]|nr:fused MFS/spermidine synthase [Ruminococcus sp.]